MCTNITVTICIISNFPNELLLFRTSSTFRTLTPFLCYSSIRLCKNWLLHNVWTTEPHKPAPLIRWDSVLHCCKLFVLTVCVSLEGFCHTPLYYLALQVPYYKKGGSNRLCGTRGFRVNEDKWLFHLSSFSWLPRLPCVTVQSWFCWTVLCMARTFTLLFLSRPGVSFSSEVRGGYIFRK